jgi:acetylornithine deacetylase/succinyl-diaminopimelate desuccinylase-like protein
MRHEPAPSSSVSTPHVLPIAPAGARGTMSTGQAFRSLAAARQRLARRDADIVRAQVELAQIAAPTGEEGERGAWVARRFAACGLRNVHVDDAGNVLGRWPSTRPAEPVVVCAHLDTVFPRDVPLAVRRDGSRIVGPGINDNGRGLAVTLALAEEIARGRLRTTRPIEFVATTGEEGAGDLRGAKHFFRLRGRDVAAVIALDGAGDERVIHRALGSRRFRISFCGAGGHSWSAFGTPNPVHAAACCASALARLSLPTEPRTTLSVGRIGGGISVNSIPDAAWLEVDLRSASCASLDRYEREIRSAARHALDEENARRAGGAGALSLTLETIGDRPGGETPVEHPLVQSALEATRLVGRSPELALASTDANVPMSRGIPAIAIGAGGRGGDAHTPREWFENADGTLGVARALTIVVAAAGLVAAD